MKNKIQLTVLFTALLLQIISCGNKNSGKSSDGKSHAIKVGIQNSPSNSLVILAAEKMFFDTAKIKVTVENFTAGKLALQALLGNNSSLDIAVSAETPVVLSTLGGNKLHVISQIVDAKNECRVVVRKDKTATTPEQYFGTRRKLVTSQGGSPEWLTYNFLRKYNLDNGKTEVLAMQPQDMPVAIANKSVDAICIFDPFARIAERQLGNDGMTFLNTDISSFYVLSVREETLSEKKDVLTEFMKGLIKASVFIKSSPEEAKEIIARYTNLDIAIINETWSNYKFDVGLSKDLFNLCADQAKWAINTGKYPANTKMPDFNAVLADAILQSAAPASIKLK